MVVASGFHDSLSPIETCPFCTMSTSVLLITTGRRMFTHEAKMTTTRREIIENLRKICKPTTMSAMQIENVAMHAE